MRPRAVLFDLDGTLADTAPDLAAAANRMLRERGLAELPLAALRPHASSGARGMLGLAFQVAPGDTAYEALKTEFLSLYSEALAVHSTLFDGVPAMLSFLESQGLAWGIVTNKAQRLTAPLLPYVGLAHAGCVVCGDTTPHAKPHPAPLLEAARRLRLEAAACWYVGDDLRDIAAGRAAGMRTVAITWGYSGSSAPSTWGADHLIAAPAELAGLLAQS
jgi:2-phosphoglycolate phosphatase